MGASRGAALAGIVALLVSCSWSPEEESPYPRLGSRPAENPWSVPSQAVAAEPGAPPIELRDDAGQVVRLSAPARRIVSLVPALTEVLYAIGASDRLVARTRFDRDPPGVLQLPSVGDGIRPAVELILAASPDLVLLFAGSDNAGSLAELRRLGVATLAVRHNTLSDLRRNIDRLGQATGCTESARALVRFLEAELARIRAATDGLDRPAVYYDLWWPPPITVGAGSFLDSLIAVAGGSNVFRDLSAPAPRVSVEAIAARDPDVIVAPLDPARPAVVPNRRPGWAALRAVREGSVRQVPADLVHRLGPRVASAAAALARALHPDVGVSTGAVEAPAYACRGNR